MGQPYTDRAYRWNRESYSRQRRFIDIWAFVLQLLYERWRFGKKWTYKQGQMTAEAQSDRRRSLAVWVRETLLELGPTFIKVGQLFSTRADLFPTEFVDELSKLQDRVPAFSYEQVVTIIEADLGKPVSEIYRNLDPIPLAAASLGQVHRAQLPTGEEVVVKVQRPGLKRLFSIDLEILRGITSYFQSHPKWGGNGRDWIGIYDECCKILWEEIDYLNEGRNADLFRRNFRDDALIRVPRVYWRYTSPRTLTLEYLPGIKISHYEALEAAGIDRISIAQLSARSYLQQLLEGGFFHADPHPGNLAVSQAGELIFYDFGMMGQLPAVTREKLMGTFMGVAQRDSERVVQSLIDLGVLVPTSDLSAVRRSVQYMMNNFLEKPFDGTSMETISDDLYDIAYGQPFRFPATFTFVMRALSTMEGVGRGLDPNFNFMEVAKPFAMKLMSNETGPGNGNLSTNIFDEFSRQAAQVSSSALGLPRRLDDALDKLEKGDLRVRVRSTETDRLLRKLSGINVGTNYTLLVCAFTLSATILLVNEWYWPAVVLASMAVVAAVALTRQLIKADRLDRLP